MARYRRALRGFLVRFCGMVLFFGVAIASIFGAVWLAAQPFLCFGDRYPEMVPEVGRWFAWVVIAFYGCVFFYILFWLNWRQALDEVDREDRRRGGSA